MELLQLKYFCDAAKTENFSTTAKKFSVPASNISQSIKRLEKELNLSLFTRYSNKIMLNENGKTFYNKVSCALSLIDDASKQISDTKETGEINICINANRRIVMSALEKFKQQYPKIHIRTMMFCDPLSENFDLVIGCDEKLCGYKSELLLCETIGIAVNKNNPLAENFNADIFKEQAFVTTSQKSSLHDTTSAICKDFGFTPNIAIQSDDPFYIRKCVDLGLGIAVVPLFSWQGQYGEDTVLRELEGYSRSTYIYTLKDKYIPRCVKNFIEILKKECE